VPAQTLSSALVHTVDAIVLPGPDQEVLGRAERRDSYPIVVTRSPEETVERLLRFVGDAKVAVITDETVARLYGPLVAGALEKAGNSVELAAVPAGERHKTLGQACELLDWMSGTEICRRDVVVNLGGGVIIDMGGWVASSYMRGVRYLNTLFVIGGDQTLPLYVFNHVRYGITPAVNAVASLFLLGSFAVLTLALALPSGIRWVRRVGERRLRGPVERRWRARGQDAPQHVD
jgi:hypothetical protein